MFKIQGNGIYMQILATEKNVPSKTFLVFLSCIFKAFSQMDFLQINAYIEPMR